MQNDLQTLTSDNLEKLYADKQTQFEEAFEEGASLEQLNLIYKELKAVRLEINLRKIAV